MTVIDLADAADRVGELDGKLREAATRGLRSAAMRGLQVLLTQIIPARSPSPVDRGTYKAGWQVDLEDPPDGASIYNAEPHSVLIEEGVDPGRVKVGLAMIQSLTEWAFRKGLAGDEEEAGEVAWSIANAMRRRGIFYPDGLGILRELVDDHLPAIIEEEVGREIGKVEL